MIGCGGVGLAVVQGALLAGAERIVAVDVSAPKLEHALALGATDAVDASAGDPVAQVRELTGGLGVEFAFSAIGAAAGLDQAVRMCAFAGTATLVGVPTPNARLGVDLHDELFNPKIALAVTHGGDTLPQEDFPFLARGGARREDRPRPLRDEHDLARGGAGAARAARPGRRDPRGRAALDD